MLKSFTMAEKVHKDTPLSELTLRRYEKPTGLAGRELVKKFCLSLGLLQPGDSRDIIVDILSALIKARKEKKELSCEEIRQKVIELRKEGKLPLLGVAYSNIRRQLKRLRDILLVEKIANTYRVNEFSHFIDIFEEKIEKYVLQSITSMLIRSLFNLISVT